MRSRSGRKPDRHIEAVAGNEPTRCRDNDGKRRIARSGRREQDAQRVALIEMGESGAAVAVVEADFGDAVRQ